MNVESGYWTWLAAACKLVGWSGEVQFVGQRRSKRTGKRGGEFLLGRCAVGEAARSSTKALSVSARGLRGAYSPFDPRCRELLNQTMTRRSLTPDSQPTTTVAARIPLDVSIDWRAAATRSDMSMSDWLRQAVEAGRMPVTGLRRPGLRNARKQADPALLRELARIGNNFNQLAHLAHIGALAGRRVDVLQVLVHIQAELHRIGSTAAAADEEKA